MILLMKETEVAPSSSLNMGKWDYGVETLSHLIHIDTVRLARTNMIRPTSETQKVRPKLIFRVGAVGVSFQVFPVKS